MTSDEIDVGWMEPALAQARLAATEGEVPVGCVIVKDNQALALAHNRTIPLTAPTAHAEILALRQAAAVTGNHRLTGCDLYVTLEPCAMCVGGCVQARIRRIVFGTPDPRWGRLGSRVDLGQAGLFNHSPQIVGGILAGPCRELLQTFFQAKRCASS